jgi:hypothetical protein
MRASNLPQAEACPGSVRLQEGLPDNDTAESREGTQLHMFDAHPEYLREVLRPHQRDLLETCDKLKAEFIRIVTQAECIPEDEEYVEEREVEAKADWANLSGHMDLARRYPRRAVTVLAELKFGYIPVDPAELNLQARGYTSMSEDDTVYVGVIQPRAVQSERLTIARYTRTELEKSRVQIIQIIARAADADAPLIAGVMQCRYCKAKIICPAFKAAYEQALIPLGSLSPQDSKAKRLGIIEARLSELTQEQIGQMIEATQLVEFVRDPLFDEARRRIEAGKLDGWKLSKPMERRKITDSQRAISLLVLAGMSRQDILECANLSITKVEEKARTYCNDDAKTTKDYVNRHLASVLEVETGKPRVLRQ